MDAKAEQTRAPLIGITADVESLAPAQDGSQRLRYQVAAAYVERVARCGGIPVIVPPVVSALDATLARLDGLIMTGGGDIIMEPLGGVTHAKASVVHPRRQEFELALLAALDGMPRFPVLAICLGMQYMTLHAGGELCQHLPDRMATAESHRQQDHPIVPATPRGESPPRRWSASIMSGLSASNHHQGMLSAGRLAVIAHAPDGMIEAVADCARPYYLGVQWHPERTEDARLGIGLIQSLVEEAAAYAKQRH